MKAFYTLILILLAGTAYGQSNLPACPALDNSQVGINRTKNWNNCFGTYAHGDGFVYVGAYQSGVPNGQGSSTYANGDRFVGEFKDGLSNGQGTHYFLGEKKFKGDKYEGEFKNGKLHGQGTYYLLADNANKGDKYVGEFKDDKRTGQGTYSFTDGRIWLGEWENFKINGKAIWYNSDGTINKSGIFKDNVLVTSQYIDPNSFTRIARNNTALTVSDSQRLPACQGSDVSKWNNCFGTANYPHEEKYIGEWSNGKANGQGTIYFGGVTEFKGDKYIGEFKDNLLHGKGTYFFLGNNKFKGDVYIGEYKHGKKSGYGTYLIGSPQYKGDKYVGEMDDNNSNGQGTYYFLADNSYKGEKHLGYFKDGKPNGQGIIYSANGSIKNSGIFKDNVLVTSQYIDPNSFTRIARNNSAPAASDSQRQEIEQRERQIELEAQRVAEERRKLDEDKRQRELAKQSNRITINASVTQPDSSGVVTINIQTNTDTSSFKINGEELGGKPDGSYSVKRVARVGQETKFILAATDVYGNTDTKSITVTRQAVDSKAVFGQLNAANVKQQPARDAVAIIIGIEKYKRVAKADFANADAQDFYDYASRALGIKPENIKLLIDDGADDVEILQAFQNWLPLKVKKGKTDVYVFFSGHGYPSEDGKGLYFLPYGVDKNYMERTAVKQKEVIASLQSVKPKSVTMFIDSCYSGQTRGGETLVAGSKPIALKQSETAYPPEFTVITASTMDQISWSSPDLKHGLFSYYLMKGMEGDSDLNKDGKVTVAEMQEYLTDMVGRHAMGMNRSQQPQLFGDPNKVLISR